MNDLNGMNSNKEQERARKRAEKQARKAQRGSNGSGSGKTVATAVISSVVTIALMLCLWSFTPIFNGMKYSGTTSTGSSWDGQITINGGDETTTAQAVASKCLNSVVTIYVYSSSSDGWSQYFGGSSSNSEPSALGSGVIISDDNGTAYILTNAHVVEGISKAVVKVGDQQYNASPVGIDEDTDLAVISIKATGLTPIEWGDSSTATVGEWVAAIGSPYGYEQTLTTGVVSALYRSDTLSSESGLGSATVYTDMIQTDAAINPGNSGGGLFNEKGQLIGINTYISSSSGSSAGLGFAIPSNEAKSVADTLIEGGTVEHPYLGIMMSSTEDGNGVLVESVYKDTAADKAGLHTGDIITGIDGKKVTSPNQVSTTVRAKKPGDTMEIIFTRNGQEQTVTATIGSDSDQTNEYAENGAPTQDNQNNGFFGNGNSNGQGNGNGNGKGNGQNEGNGGGFDPFGFGLDELFGNGGSSNGGFWH